MSDRRVTWRDHGRGPRVEINIGSESVVTTVEHARELRDDLSAVLDEIEPATTAPGASTQHAGLASTAALDRFGVDHDLSDEDFLLNHVAGDTGFTRPLIREIKRRRAAERAKP